MHYGITTEATGFSEQALNDWRVRLLKTALFFIPRANPDTERFYPQVKQWVLELSDDGWPQREVALGESGNVLFRTPDHRNTGFWTDMARKQFKLEELRAISAEQFHSLWQAGGEVGA
jgi:hypothetical protein